MDFGSSNCIPILIGGNKQGYLVGMIVKIPKRLVYAELAQLGEHLPYKQWVTGSNPVLRTILGYRQAVRPRTLTPVFAGSNPASPAKRLSRITRQVGAHHDNPFEQIRNPVFST